MRRGLGRAQVRGRAPALRREAPRGRPGDPGPSPGATQLLPSLIQRSGAGACNQRPGRGRGIRRGFQKQNLAHRRAEERVMGAWEGLRPRSLDSYR